MTKEEKELLLKDLCARLPYGVKCIVTKSRTEEGQKEDMGKITYICLEGVECIGNEPFFSEFGNFKPYLFPLSSMTDKELIEFFQIRGMNLNTYELRTFRRRDIAIASTLSSYSRHIDWLNARHFDYRGLIEKGLAIDASGLNIY